jgi:hypothetical protein
MGTFFSIKQDNCQIWVAASKGRFEDGLEAQLAARHAVRLFSHTRDGSVLRFGA